MKKITFLLTFMLFTLGIGNAWGAEVYFEDSFSNVGTSSNATVSSRTGWTSLTQCYGQYNSGLRIGSSKNAGTLTKTAMTNISGTKDLKVTIYTAKYSSDGNSFTITTTNGTITSVTGVGKLSNGTLTVSPADNAGVTSTTAKATWKDAHKTEFIISGATSSTTIKFATNKRAILGPVTIEDAASEGGDDEIEEVDLGDALKWSAAAATVQMGADDNEYPTLTNDKNATITYSSSSTEVATIDANGVVTLLKEGTTTISAFYEGGEIDGVTYAAKNVSYTLTVKPAPLVIEPIEGGIIDILTHKTFTSTGSYANFSGKQAANENHSDAVYAGRSARNGNATQYSIQLNTIGTGRIATTTTGGLAKRVYVKWATQGNANANNRTLDIYGSNDAFTGSETSTSATKIGTITFTTGATEAYVDLTGDYKYILMTGSAAIYMDEIQVTWVSAAGTVVTPTISGEAEFVESTEVSITCATSGAKIYYTTDGTEPTNASAEYTAPFELSATTTVKAIAYVDGQASAVATMTFTFIETITCVQAAEIALAQSANNVQTEKKYRIIAYVTETLSSVSSNQQSFKVVDNIGDESVFQSYYCNVLEAMAAGMKVEMIGKLSKYNDAAQMKNGDVTILEKPVAAPKILGADAFETSTEVTITAEEGLKIFYTLNGDDPTTSSTEYTAPFELTETKTVKAIAYNSTTAKSSAVTEKTFTKTIIPTKTIAAFIEDQGGRCYLEGIVSNITNTTYGNFDLTDASGTIYVYGCLNASGEAQKFASLGVKAGDKIKVIAEEYEYYNSTTHEVINAQYVSHISAATIEIADITMEVGETTTIAATVTPVGATVSYSIKNGSEYISVNGAEITANAVGTATITASVADGADYLANSVDFTVTVNAKSTKEKVVILAEYEGQWYAMKAQYVTGRTSHLAPLPVTYFDGKLYNVSEEDKALIEWERAVVDGKATFYNNGKYLSGISTETNLTLATTACEWAIDGSSYLQGDRTFFYNAENNWFRNFKTSNAEQTNFSSLPVVTAPVYATGDIVYTRSVTAGNLGTICLPFNVPAGKASGATFYTLAGREANGRIAFYEVTGELEAGKSYLFQANAAEIVCYCGTTSVLTPDENGAMRGTFEDVTLSDLTNIYYFAGTALWSCVDLTSLSVPANRAYVNMAEMPNVPTSNPAPGVRRISLGVNGQQVATGMENIDASAQPMKMIIDGQLYILRGEKMYDAQGKLVK